MIDLSNLVFFYCQIIIFLMASFSYLLRIRDNIMIKCDTWSCHLTVLEISIKLMKWSVTICRSIALFIPYRINCSFNYFARSTNRMQGKLQIQLQFKKIDISKFNFKVVINFFHFIIIGYKLVYSTFNVAIKIPKVRGRKIMFIQVFLFIYI